VNVIWRNIAIALIDPAMGVLSVNGDYTNYGWELGAAGRAAAQSLDADKSVSSSLT
jgi:hypothetical protein